MTVSAYGAGTVWFRQASQAFRSLDGELAALQTQLATGRRAETYAGLGAAAPQSLSGRALLSSLASYEANVSDAALRLSLMSPALAHIGRLAREMATSLVGSFNHSQIGQTKAQLSAEDGLGQVVDLLNSEIGGRYLFAGRASDTEPVVSVATMLDGLPGQAGLRQLIAERKAADAGLDGLGRLLVSATGAAVSVAEEAAGLPFGFKIVGAQSTGPGLSAAVAAGPPASAGLTLAAQPAEGDAIGLELALPDGTRATVTLTARANPGPAEGGAFAVGATPAETAQNLAAAITLALQELGSTALAAASAMTASASFFAGTAANTVIWYRGEAGAGSPRETAAVRTGEGTGVVIGARANEPGFQRILAALGALAGDSFAQSDPAARARYGASADRIATSLADPPLGEIAAELGSAKASLQAASERLAAGRAQVEDVLSAAESADPSEVAAQLLATQTRLQASYQSTAAIGRLSLVDFL